MNETRSMIKKVTCQLFVTIHSIHTCVPLALSRDLFPVFADPSLQRGNRKYGSFFRRHSVERLCSSPEDIPLFELLFAESIDKKNKRL